MRLVGHLNETGERFVFTERVCKTIGGDLVREGHRDGRWLFAIPGQDIKVAEAISLGLVIPGQEPSADVSETEDVPTGSAAEILAWVAGDRARAQAALETESHSAKPRKQLSADLAAIVAASDDTNDEED
jgi:hypothetical protein